MIHEKSDLCAVLLLMLLAVNKVKSETGNTLTFVVIADL